MIPGPDPLFILETERLVLRRQLAADVAFLVGLWSDPDVTRHLGGPRDRAWLRSVFEETAADPFREDFDLWPVVEKASGLPVGHCGLLPKEVENRPEIEVNYILARSAWGRGYASEIAAALERYAADQLGLRRLIALISPENGASEHVARRIGMRLEGETVRPGGAIRRVYAANLEETPWKSS